MDDPLSHSKNNQILSRNTHQPYWCPSFSRTLGIKMDEVFREGVQLAMKDDRMKDIISSQLDQILSEGLISAKLLDLLGESG
jgi:hypothetical protein